MPRISYNLPTADGQAMIVCLHCAKPQEVGRKAKSITCRFCYKPLKLEDIKISQYEARRVIETVGVVTVEKKGWVFADRIHCGGLVVRGKVKGDITSYGPVRISPEGEVKGNVTAPSLAVEAGALLEGYYQIGSSEG